MITPYIVVACEKAIIDQDSVPSLISLFTKMIVNAPAEADVPENAVAPNNWVIFSIWNLEPGDEKRECILCTEILYPSGKPFTHTIKTKMPLEADKRAQMAIKVQGFPIGQEGPYKIRTWIEETGKMLFDPIEFKIDLQINRQSKEANQLMS
jgi:hypothetical protein